MPWTRRMRLMARLRSAAMTCGPLAVRSWWRSSSKMTSLTDVELVLDSPVPLDPGGNLLGLGIGHGQGADPGRPLSSSGFCGGWFIWCWLFLVVGVGCPGGFVLGGGSLADGGVRANGALPVDLLGGGEHGRRRCPPRGPGQRMSSALYSELSASARAKPKGTRYLVGGPGWSGAGPAGVGAGVLPLSLDDPGGRESPAAAGRW